MAELNQKTENTGGKKVRIRKAAPKVDLTAMVDLAFLLITFFMLTTSLNKPHSLDIAMPDNRKENAQDMDERRIVSIIVAEDKISWYHGDLKKPFIPPTEVSLDASGLRRVLLQMKNSIPQLVDGKDMIVLIKPSQEARTIDIIKTLDEMKITDIKRYLISKTSKEEENIVVASN